MSKFYQGVKCGKGDELGLFNIAVYWKRKYRHKGPKEPWYILRNLPNLKQTLCLYRCRWGIEQFFKDCKTGGYNLEDTKVNETRFLALVLLIVIAYSLAVRSTDEKIRDRDLCRTDSTTSGQLPTSE
jgi:IS4 transposase